MADKGKEILTLRKQLIKYAEDMSSLHNEMKKIKKKADRVDLFTRSVAHDLKNLTIGAHGFTNLLNKRYRNLLDKKGKTFLDRILESSAQSTALVEKINSFTRYQKAPLCIEAIHLKDILRIIRDDYSERLNSCKVKLSEPGRLPVIHADRLAVLRVMRNLIDNSFKYGGEAMTSIDIGYSESEEFHIISVKDNGAGINTKDADRLFEKFYRDKPSGKIEGLGLGLAIVKGLVKRHKGKVWIETSADRGVTFYISIYKKLPLSPNL